MSDIVQMLGGGRVRVNTRSFQNDMRNFRTKDDVLTLLIHLGYLAYDSWEEEAFIPNIELKYDRTAHTAIQQIKDRKYTQSFEGYVGKILAVGINYDRNNADKPHSCVIERMKKQYNSDAFADKI